MGEERPREASAAWWAGKREPHGSLAGLVAQERGDPKESRSLGVERNSPSWRFRKREAQEGPTGPGQVWCCREGESHMRQVDVIAWEREDHRTFPRISPLTNSLNILSYALKYKKQNATVTGLKFIWNDRQMILRFRDDHFVPYQYKYSQPFITPENKYKPWTLKDQSCLLTRPGLSDSAYERVTRQSSEGLIFGSMCDDVSEVILALHQYYVPHWDFCCVPHYLMTQILEPWYQKQ